jgi:hypothetical protein
MVLRFARILVESELRLETSSGAKSKINRPWKENPNYNDTKSWVKYEDIGEKQKQASFFHFAPFA